MRVSFPSTVAIRDGEWADVRGLLASDLDGVQAAINTTWEVEHNVDGTQTAESIGDPLWVNIRFNSAFYTTNSAGNITVSSTQPYVYRYVNRINSIHFQFANRITINNATTTEIRIALPQSFRPMPYDQTSGTDENQAAGFAIFNDSTGISGAAAAFINVTGRYISIQRADGVLAAGYNNGSTTFMRGEVSIPGAFVS